MTCGLLMLAPLPRDSFTVWSGYPGRLGFHPQFTSHRVPLRGRLDVNGLYCTYSASPPPSDGLDPHVLAHNRVDA